LCGENVRGGRGAGVLEGDDAASSEIDSKLSVKDVAFGPNTDERYQLSSSITFIVYDKVIGVMDTFGRPTRDATQVQKMV